MSGQFVDNRTADWLGCPGDYADEAVLPYVRAQGYSGVPLLLHTSLPSDLYGEKCSLSLSCCPVGAAMVRNVSQRSSVVRRDDRPMVEKLYLLSYLSSVIMQLLYV